jgi:hypothetical protein
LGCRRGFGILQVFAEKSGAAPPHAAPAIRPAIDRGLAAIVVNDTHLARIRAFRAVAARMPRLAEATTTAWRPFPTPRLDQRKASGIEVA